MKFIVDAQLPRSLSELLKECGHDSIHTIELQNGNATKDNIVTQISLLEKRVVY